MSSPQHPGSARSVASIGFGCVNLGSARGGRSERADVALVHEALDLGVRVFDTADAYGAGASERVLGRALRSRRDGIVIATKGGYLFRERSGVEQRARRVAATVQRRLPTRGGDDAPTTAAGGYAAQDHSPKHLRAAVEASLRRLRTDHIDLYQLHGPHEVFPHVFDELVDLRASGKVGAFGIGAESVGEAVDWLPVAGLSTVQVPFGILDPDAADELIGPAHCHDTRVWVRGVLGGGLLARAERSPEKAEAGPKGAVLRRLRELGEATGTGTDALAVAYVRSFDVATVLFGISSSAHLRRNVALMSAAPPDPLLLAALTEIAGRAPTQQAQPDA
jgi:aryl-alcohol dehydrogenase-like predicted oxidoreductase